MRHFAYLLLILVHSSIFCFGKEPKDSFKKINEMSLLFPHIPDSKDLLRIQYKLTAFNGCYEWLSSNINILVVEGIPDESNRRCQSNAVVTVVQSRPIAHGLWIAAKDKGLFKNIFFFD